MQTIAPFLPRSSEQHWAAGCDKCRYGLVGAPDILGSVSLYEGRAVAHVDGLLLYCDCRAGLLYRQHLRKVAETLNEWSRNSIRGHMAAANVPTIRLEVTT